MTASDDQYHRTDDIAIVSGSAEGIGGAVARRLYRRGATVVMLEQDTGRPDVTGEEFTSATRGRMLRASLDLGSPESVEQAAAAVLDRFGRVDVLVNATADVVSVAPFLEAGDDLWLDAVTTRLLGTVRLTRAVAHAMTARGSGRIVIVGGSSRKEPDPLMIIDATMNAALSTFAKGLAHGLGPAGLRINVVEPGFLRSRFWNRAVEQLARRFGTSPDTVNADVLATTPYGELPTPDDVAEVITFLLSDAARHVNGASLTVDGGAARAV